MKRQGALQVIFAIFLGLVLVAFVWIGLLTFYPQPSWSAGGDKAIEMWQIISGILLLLIATAISAVSLALPARLEVISNGLLLGGIFTMLSSVGVAFTLEVNGWRFAVVTAALMITVGIGYLRFGRGPRHGATGAAPTADLPVAGMPTPGFSEAVVSAPGVPDQGGAAGPTPVVPDLAARVAALESRLDALRRALD